MSYASYSNKQFQKKSHWLHKIKVCFLLTSQCRKVGVTSLGKSPLNSDSRKDVPSIFVKPPASTDGLHFHQEKGRESIDSDMGDFMARAGSCKHYICSHSMAHK